MIKCLPTMRETWVQFLGWEDPLEKEMATHSSTLAWKIPWTEEPGRLHPVGSQRVRHDWATSLSLFTFIKHGSGTALSSRNALGATQVVFNFLVAILKKNWSWLDNLLHLSRFKILSFQHVISIKMIQRFYLKKKIGTEPSKSIVHFIFTAYLNLNKFHSKGSLATGLGIYIEELRSIII